MVAHFDIRVSPVSGVYVRRLMVGATSPIHFVTTDVLRLDVDHTLPLQVASGRIVPSGLFGIRPFHWYAPELTKVAQEDAWEGKIVRFIPELDADQSALFPYDSVRIEAQGGGPLLQAAMQARVIFSAPGVPDDIRTFDFQSRYFRDVEFEFDRIEGVPAAQSISPQTLPDHAPGLPTSMSLRKVFSSAGINLRTSPGSAQFHLHTSNDIWTPRELHRDLLFASAHEMAHCFNLVHSWEKAYPTPWIPPRFVDDLALSFMNYPEGVPDFWTQFQWQFTPQELYFLRHAPEEFVAMARQAYGENHAYTAAHDSPSTGLSLEVSVRQERGLLEFLEPAFLDVKLINTSKETLILDAALLARNDALRLVVARRTGGVTNWQPYLRRCIFPNLRRLAPGQSISTSILVSASAGGWHIDEPGSYTVWAALETEHGVVSAQPLQLRVAVPEARVEELLAQDLFCDAVARTLTFEGTRVMTNSNAILREVLERAKDRQIARHAAVALGLPLMRKARALRLPEGKSPMRSVAEDGGVFEELEARPAEGRALLTHALRGQGAEATFPADKLKAYCALIEARVPATAK